MIQRYEWDFSNPYNPQKKDLGTVEYLFVAKTDYKALYELREKGIDIPFITQYLWETKEAAIRWAHHCLRSMKNSIKEIELYSDLPNFTIEYQYTVNGSTYTIARVSTTCLICDHCSNEDW